MRRFHARPMAVLAVLAALAQAASAQPAAAEDSPPASAPTPSAFDGRWVYAGGPEEDRARVRAIEAVTEDLPAFKRGTARERLRERTALPRTLELKVAGNRVQLSQDGKDVGLELGARPREVDKDGKRGALAARLDGEQVVVVAASEDSKVTTRYAVAPDRGQLMLSVRLEADALPRPLEYRATYQLKPNR